MPGELFFVFDTNAIISAALLKRSVTRQAFDRALEYGHFLLSPKTLNELHEVLQREEFDKYVEFEERLQFLNALVREAILIDATETIIACRDPKDDKFLELAVSGHAQCIVSGDQDLLVLNPFRSIPILTPRSFLEYSWEHDRARL